VSLFIYRSEHACIVSITLREFPQQQHLGVHKISKPSMRTSCLPASHILSIQHSCNVMWSFCIWSQDFI